jgi:hypothetical protein
MEETIKIGQWAAPFLMTGILAVVFSFFTRDDGSSILSNRLRNAIALFFGVLLAYVALVLKWDAGGYAVTITDAILYFIAGIILGATAVGLWKTVNIQIRGKE